MAEEDFLAKLNAVEQRLDRLERRIRKQVEERKLDLKEKFRLHDRAQALLQHFEQIDAELFLSNKLAEELKQIVKSLAELVDVALGVKFP